jgi:2-dehydro-3-deoxygluconokinase
MPPETDLATFGETMVRLSPRRGERVATADEFAVHVGGAESNVAAAATALGLSTVWLSKVLDSPPGDRVVRGVRACGVEPAVVRAESDGGRQGLYYFEDGPAPRGSTVTYDRGGTAIASATTDELPVERVRSARAFHVSGITPALSSTLEATTADLIEAASEADRIVSFDPNYRSKLWSPAEARETLTPLLSAVDVLTVAERDARAVFEREGSAADVAREMRAAHGATAVVVTRGEDGAVAAGSDGVVEQAAFDTETVDPVGSGDALVGGFLARWLRGGDLAAALRDGVATAALARTLAGDAADAVTPDDLRRIRGRDGTDGTLSR